MKFCTFVWCVALAWPAQASARQAASGFTLSGTVVDRASGNPVKKAAVLIVATPQADRSEGYLTGADGRFLFEHLPAGKYNLSARARGYRQQAFRDNDNYSTGIAVGPGLDSTHILFPLVAAGSISGTVIDEEGDPVQSAQISFWYRGVVSGELQTMSAGSTATRSSGTFHFGELLPGNYFVSVQAHPWYAVDTAEDPDLNVAYPLTFYAGTTDGAAASPIAVAAGSDTKIQIALHAIPALHVEITGFDPKSNSGVNVILKEPGPPGSGEIGVYVAGLVQGDKFVVRGVAPGHYEVELSQWTPKGQSILASGAEDLTDNGTVDLSAAPKLSISGSLTFDGGERPPDPPSIFFMNGTTSMVARVDKNGAFALNEAALPGQDRHIVVQSASYYLKSIAVKGAKFSRGELQLPASGSVQLSLIAAKGTSAVPGVVLKDGKPLPGAMVLAIPADLNRTDLIRRDQSDSDGTFTLYNVPPGRYTLVAIDDGHEFEYGNPSVIQPYLSAGRVIDVPVGHGSKLQLEVQQRKH